MSPATVPRMVLDFDGVICDPANECRLVTWLAAHPPDPSLPISSYLVAVERGFAARFMHIRGYARLLEHFVVAHHPGAEAVSSRAEFTALFGSIPGDEVAAFVEAAGAVRRRFRTEETFGWAALHPLYRGVAKLFRDHPGVIAVASARDSASVYTILDYRGLGGTVAEVAGECRSKADAVLDLCARYGLDPGEITFVDDNLENVTAVAAAGASAYWAMWGHHVPEDLAVARQAGVRRLELDELPQIIPV